MTTGLYNYLSLMREVERVLFASPAETRTVGFLTHGRGQDNEKEVQLGKEVEMDDASGSRCG